MKISKSKDKCIAIYDAIFKIRDKVYHKLGDIRSTDIAMEPLVWYISTGRAPLDFEKLIKSSTSRQFTTIANRLIKYSYGDFQEAINSICQYIGFRRDY